VTLSVKKKSISPSVVKKKKNHNLGNSFIFDIFFRKQELLSYVMLLLKYLYLDLRMFGYLN